MANQSQEETTTQTDYLQLTQVRVPLEDADDAFMVRDATGRIPIVLVPRQLNRIRNDLVLFGVLVLVGGIAAGILLNSGALIVLAILAGVVLLALGLYRSFLVAIPEGASGLLARGGRYHKTIGSGTSVVPPWIIVSHVVTGREIPFDVPIVEAPSKDNVRASVDILVTFSIADPYKFVYRIAADDFDHVFQAICQDRLRSMIRSTNIEEVVDLGRRDLSELCHDLNAAAEAYGVAISKVAVPFAQPPAEFMRSHEERKLATIQHIEHKEKQALAVQKQADVEALLRQEVEARVARERLEFQRVLQQAEDQRRVVELEAEAEELRLAKLEARLQAYPMAAQYEWEGTQLKVAQALAHNTRAVVQVGKASEIASALVLGDLMRFTPPAMDDAESEIEVELAPQLDEDK